MTDILMPRLSDTMEEGVISSWHKKPGDRVATGEVIVDIETDKAVMEYEAFEAGVLDTILVQEGESAPIGAAIAVLATGSPVSGGPQPPPVEGPAPEPSATARPNGRAGSSEPARPEPPAAPAAPANGRPTRPPSSPLARRLARDNGIDLTALSGSGPGGRVVRADVEAAARAAAPAPRAPAPAAATAPGEEPDVERVPLSRFRKVTARRLSESKREAPHYYLTRVVDVEELLGFRARLNAALAPDKVSVTDLIVKACASALRGHPEVNVSFTEEHLLVHGRVNVGVAVAIDEGLVVPVIRDADRKSVSQIGAEARELAGRARERRLTVEEMSGSTFTVSNLGMYGIDEFTAVINPPESAILAVGAGRQEPVVRDGQIVPRHRMTVTLSLDHRAIDGATGALFLGDVVELLENPLRIVA